MILLSVVMFSSYYFSAAEVVPAEAFPCCENRLGIAMHMQRSLEPILPTVLLSLIKDYIGEDAQFVALIDDMDHSAQLHTERINLSSTFHIFVQTIHDTLTLLQIEVYREPNSWTTSLDSLELRTERRIIHAIQHKYDHIPLYAHIEKPKSFNTNKKVSFRVLLYLNHLLQRKAELMPLDDSLYIHGTYRSLMLLAPGLTLQRFGVCCSNTYAELMALHQSPQFSLLPRHKQSCTIEYAANYKESGKEKFDLLKATKHGETGVLFSRPMSFEQYKHWQKAKWVILC